MSPIALPGLCAKSRAIPFPRASSCYGRLGPRMMRAIHLLEPFFHYVRVDLRCGDVGVTEHHLHGPQIRAAIQKMRGEAVTQHVRLQLLRQARFSAEI